MLLFLPLVLPALLQAAPPLPPPAATVTPSQAPSDARAPAAETRVLGLDEAVQVALKHQPTVLQAQATTRAASGRADQARSGLLPQVAATASYTRAHGAVLGVNGPTTGAFDVFTAGANASQLIWDFGQTWERTHAAERTTDSIRISERTAELTVMLSVRRAYFQARAQKALIRVADDTLVNLERHMKQIQGFVTVGTRPEIDLAQAKSDLATERVVLINAQNGYRIAKAQLAAAMGTPGGEFEVSNEELAAIDVEEQPIDQLTKTALAARPELVSLIRQSEAQELTVKSIKGGYGPILSAVAAASESGTALDALGTRWSLGATLSWPIFQGGLTNGQVREAEANVDVTRAQLDGEKLQVRLDVEQAALNVRAAKSEIQASNEALTNTKERLRLAEGRYEAGVGSIIELGDAQVAQSSAAQQVVQAEFDLSLARAQLLTAMGRR
jgi:outer membrane protein